MLHWDLAAGRGQRRLPRLQALEVNEFDYKGVNQVIYEENGVTIRSFPAIHSIDGAGELHPRVERAQVRLQLRHLSRTSGSSSYAKDADLAIHECFIAVPDLVNKMRFTPESALLVGTQVHTAPEAFGKVMSADRAAHRRRLPLLQGLRHDGRRLRAHPQDLRRPAQPRRGLHGVHQGRDAHGMRLAVEEHTWSPPLSAPAIPPGANDRQTFAQNQGVPLEAIGYSDFIKCREWDVDDVLRPVYEERAQRSWAGSSPIRATDVGDCGAAGSIVGSRRSPP